MGRHIEELRQELLNDHWRHCYMVVGTGLRPFRL